MPFTRLDWETSERTCRSGERRTAALFPIAPPRVSSHSNCAPDKCTTGLTLWHDQLRSAVPDADRGTICGRMHWLGRETSQRRITSMGRYLLLWLLGVPIPILILIWAFGGLH